MQHSISVYSDGRISERTARVLERRNPFTFHEEKHPPGDGAPSVGILRQKLEQRHYRTCISFRALGKVESASCGEQLPSSLPNHDLCRCEAAECTVERNGRPCSAQEARQLLAVPRRVWAVEVAGQVSDTVTEVAVEVVEVVEVGLRELARVGRREILPNALGLDALWQAAEALHHAPRDEYLRGRAATPSGDRSHDLVLEQRRAATRTLEAAGATLREGGAAVRVSGAEGRVGHQGDVVLAAELHQLRLREKGVQFHLIYLPRRGGAARSRGRQALRHVLVGTKQERRAGLKDSGKQQAAVNERERKAE